MQTIDFYWFLPYVWETGPPIISQAATVTPFRVCYRGDDRARHSRGGGNPCLPLCTRGSGLPHASREN